MSDVLSFARARAEDVSYPLPNTDTFEEEQARFFSILEGLSECLKRGAEFRETDAQRLLQGPLTDAMTHAGQLAMLRRLSQSPIPPESFHEAAIETDNVSRNQAQVEASAEWMKLEGSGSVAGTPSRILIVGVPRSGKSRLAHRLAKERGLTHVPLDSLVSSFEDTFPKLGIGWDGENHFAKFAPFLANLLEKLSHEQNGFVVEGYSVDLGLARQAAKHIKVVALGYVDASAEEKVAKIRAFEQEADWTSQLSDSVLFNLILRFKDESQILRAACEHHGLSYFDMSLDDDASFDQVFDFLVE